MEPLTLPWLPVHLVERRCTREDEVADVRALLLDHANPAAGSDAECAALAEHVAVACLGDQHLWQDLQLASRAELSALMAPWFPSLVARNAVSYTHLDVYKRQPWLRKALMKGQEKSFDFESDGEVQS